MTDEFYYEPAALEHDVAEFDGWRSQLAHMADVVGTAPAASFSTIPGAADAHSTYTKAAEMLRAYLTDGAAEFETYASRLRATTRIYAEAEAESMDDIAVVTRKLDSL